MMSNNSATESEIRTVLESWAAATREGRQDDILKNHAIDLVIFDVLPPMKYVSAESYRRSWEEWQPESQGEATFNLENLSITASQDVAFAYSFIRCGGTLPDGRTFQDLVRATFCLRKENGSWIIKHQHISKPIGDS
ncbi:MULTISPECIES: nuclear transport factor 2 family protein [Marinobacter]|jgi:ketosteroid isomerase-like protein|uniref:YybH family protein n=2 Tax=Marinobacteraceae TaxID=2887365 RepID=UPI001BCD2A05|nr:nuclear transport factor 2 family protein [Marinobacter salarius]WOI18372.1 nuclear transport factor 2 family protein [Marinobacter salarius]